MRLTGTTTLNQSEPGINGNERVPHTPQILRTGASLSDAVKYHIQDTLGGVFTSLQGMQSF